jgi:DNA repair protein RadC
MTLLLDTFYGHAPETAAFHASSIIVAHNHPSGSRVPSQADIDMARKLARCLNILDIELVDHAIVAAGRCESLRNLGFV